MRTGRVCAFQRDPVICVCRIWISIRQSMEQLLLDRTPWHQHTVLGNLGRLLWLHQQDCDLYGYSWASIRGWLKTRVDAIAKAAEGKPRKTKPNFKQMSSEITAHAHTLRIFFFFFLRGIFIEKSCYLNSCSSSLELKWAPCNRKRDTEALGLDVGGGGVGGRGGGEAREMTRQKARWVVYSAFYGKELCDSSSGYIIILPSVCCS